MKICFLNCLYSSQYGGGLKTQIRHMSHALAGRGHQVTIVTSGEKKVYQEGDVKIVQVGELEPLTDRRKAYASFYLMRRLRYMVNATVFIRKNSFDIVEAADGGFEHLFLVFNKKSKIITRLYGTTVHFRDVGFVDVIKFFEKMTFQKSDALLSPSDSYSEFIVGNYEVPKRNFTVIPFSIDRDVKYDHVDVRQKYQLKGKKIALFTAMLTERKGVDILLALAEDIKDTKKDVIFIVLGENVDRYDTAGWPSNVLYLGQKSGDELWSFYSECDLFFFPTRLESFGISALEAMLFGKPVLASDVTGIKDVVRDGVNGYLFDIGKPEDLYEKFGKLIDDPELSGRFGRQGKEIAEEYDILKIAKQTESFYKELCRT